LSLHFIPAFAFLIFSITQKKISFHVHKTEAASKKCFNDSEREREIFSSFFCARNLPADVDEEEVCLLAYAGGDTYRTFIMRFTFYVFGSTQEMFEK
jgi:hypothetical protein